MSHRVPPELDEVDGSHPMEVPRWFAAYTAPRQEKTAEAALKDLGFATYLPCETSWCRHARRKTKVARPLFPRYLFVMLTDADFYAARKAQGLEFFVSGAGDRPLPVSPFLVAELRSAETAGSFDHTAPRPRLQPDQMVKVIQGPFTGLSGRVVKTKGQGRVEVLLSMFRGQWPHTLDEVKVRAA